MLNFKQWLEVQIPIDQLFVRKDSYQTAIKDNNEGRPTRSDGHPFVIPIETGGYYIWDGYHRLAANGPTEFEIKPIPNYGSMVPAQDAVDLMPLASVMK